MAQDVTLDPTTTSGGAVIHTDELSSGAHVQRIKIGLGNPGVYSDVSAANPFPVTGTVAASIGNTVTVVGSVSDGAVVSALAGTLSVSDGAVVSALSGTLIVSDGAVVAALAPLSGTVVVSDGAVVGALNSVTTSGAFRVNIDSTNIAIGGGTQYSVGTSGVASTGVGNLMIATRDDVLSTLASSEGEAVGLRVDSTGALWVAAAPGDAETTDGATLHSAGVSRQVNVGFVSQPNTVSMGVNTIGMAGMNSERAIYVSIREDVVGIGGGTSSDGATHALLQGTLSVSDGAAVSHLNTLAGTVSGGAILVSIQKDDVGIGGGTQYSVGTSGVASAGVGTLSLATRDDALSTLASGEGQAVGLRVDSTGALWVNNVGTAPTAVSDGAVVSLLSGTLVVSDGAVVAALGGTLTVDGSAVTQPVSIAGTVAVSDGAVVSALGGVLTARLVGASSTQISDGGNSITVDNGGTFAVQAAQSGSWVVSDGAVVAALGGTLSVSDGAVATILNSAADTTGAFVTRPHTSLESLVTYNDSTVTTGSIAVSSGFTATAGLYNYITDITVTNSSATDTVVQLRNGAAGAVFWTMPVPANGGATLHFSAPLKQPSLNTTLAFDPLTAVTTLYISINGFQAQG